ncbi:unnamed protein product [Ectocarpus sp. 6 AP-2014]
MKPPSTMSNTGMMRTELPRGLHAGRVLGYRVQQECFSAAEAAPVQVLLADAQKDRTWRRRGRLVLSRTFPDKVRVRAGGGGANARMGRRVRVRGVAAAASGDVRARGLNGVMTTVVGLEEGVFRNIVKFL